MTTPAAGEPIAEYRGDGTGAFADCTPPLQFGEASHIAWKTPMPQWSNSSVVVTGRLAFTCSEPSNLICLDAMSGQILWQRENDHLDLWPPAQAAAAKAKWREEEAFEQKLNLLRYDWLRLTSALQSNPGDVDARDQLERLNQKLNSEHLYVQSDKLGYAKRSPESLARNEARRELSERYGLYFDTWMRWDRWIGMSMPTPVSDGAHVWAVFGTNTAVCYDTMGHRKWMKWFPKGPDRHYKHVGDPYWNSYPRALFVPSPLLVDGKLVVQMGRSIRALDAATGRQLWAGDIDRYIEYAVGSPVAMKLASDTLIITAFGDVRLLSDGRLLASGVGFSPNASSPTVAGDVVYFENGKNPGGVVHGVRNTLEAVRLSLDGSGRLTIQQLWSIESDGGFISPVIHGGLLFHEDARRLAVLDAATGKLLNTPIPIANQYTSLTLAGKYLFLVDCDGNFTMLTAESNPKRVGEAKLKPDAPTGPKLEQRKRVSGELHWQFTQGLPFFAGDRMYIRSYDNVYCITDSASK